MLQMSIEYRRLQKDDLPLFITMRINNSVRRALQRISTCVQRCLTTIPAIWQTEHLCPGWRQMVKG